MSDYALESHYGAESKLDKVLDALLALGLSDSHGAGWEIKKLREYRGALLAHAPFRVGDRAKLDRPPDIARSSGWWGSRHFLVRGAPCVIRVVDWHVPRDEADPAKGYWVVAAMFDRQSYLSPYDEDNKKLPDGQVREVLTKPAERSIFYMGADRFVKA